MDLGIRGEFPVLKRCVGGHPVTYLDSAATTLKPLSVLQKEREYSTIFTANVHRGKHLLSEEASEAYEEARSRTGRFLSVPTSSVVFVRNATEAINIVARGLGLAKADKVLVPISEHHSNILPWMREATVAWIDHNGIEPLEPAAVAAAIDWEKPRVVALSIASNVTGVINPVREICRLARDRGVVTCLDGSQAVPHQRVDVGELGCDYIAFSGHKMLGPAGTGVLTGCRQSLERLDPLTIGGGCVEAVTTSGFTFRNLPYRLEAGTPNISGAIGLAAAIDFIDKLGFETIEAHQRRMGDVLEQAAAGIKGCRLLMASRWPRVAIGSLAVESEHVTPEHVAVSLSENYGVMVRSGFFCAHPLIERFGISNGLLRVSIYVYNTEEEIEIFEQAVGKILKRFVG